MARGISLAPLIELDFVPGPQEFSPLTASILGDNISERDGWDDELQKFAALFEGGDDLLSGMAGHIPAADFQPGDFHGDNIVPLLNDTATFICDGGPLFDAMVAAIVGPGNGGGDGGGNGGGGLRCDPFTDPKCPCPPGQIRLPDGTCGFPNASA